MTALHVELGVTQVRGPASRTAILDADTGEVLDPAGTRESADI